MHAGVPNPDFKKLDGDRVHCKHINQAALDWGLSKASQHALDRYNKYGNKMVIADDIGPLDVGPVWLWTYMQYTSNIAKTETYIRAPMMSTPTNYWESQVRGFHYCKVLSPFRVLEWIYYDSLKDHDSRKHHSDAQEFIQ